MSLLALYAHPRYRILRQIVEWGLFGATVLLATFGLVRVIPTLLAIPVQQDFGAYYVAASLLNQDLPLYQWDTPLTDARLVEIPHTAYIYPPFLATVLRPLVLVSHPVAIRVWFGINIIAFVITMVILMRLFKLPWWMIGPIAGLSLLLPAVYDTWLLGQMSVLLTLLFALMLTWSVAPTQRKWQPYAVGILLGIAIVIKIYPIFLGLVYLAHRRFRTVLATGVTVLSAFLIGIGFGGGWQNTADWFTKVLPAASTMTPYPSNQSLRAVVARLFTSNEFQVPVLNKDNLLTILQPSIIESPALKTIVTTGAILLVFGVTVWVMWKPAPQAAATTFTLDFALGITLMLLLTPVVWDQYFVHLLIPLLLLGQVARRSSLYRLLVLGSMLLIALQRYWRYVLLYASSPLLMMTGLSCVVLLWLTLLRLRTHPLETPIPPFAETASGSTR